MTTNETWEKDGFVMRSATKADAEAYYRLNYDPLDWELARLTGCKEAFEREKIVSFVHRCVDAQDCYLFFVLDADGRIIGESVVNEIDPERRCANFRIAIFHPGERGKGIGTWMVETTRDFAFGQLGLHRLELDVFSFNPRAERVYRKAGFQREGILRDAVRDGDAYADDILMGMLEDDWRQLRKARNAW